MRVRELMTHEVVVVPPETPMSRCLATMHERRFRTLPVVDADRRPLGLLTEALAAAASPEAEARTAMAAVVVTARPDEPVYDVLNRCTWALQDAALVVADGKLVGILTEFDAVRRAADVLSDELRVEDHASTSLVCVDAARPALEAYERMQRAYIRDMVVLEDRRLLGILGERECIAARVTQNPGLTAASLVPTDPSARQHVFWDTPLREAATLMVRHNLGCLPVVSDDGQLRVEAVVSRADVVRALLASGAVGEADLSIEEPPA